MSISGGQTIQVAGNGKTLTAAGATARTTIPARADGTAPRRILVIAQFNNGLAGIHGANVKLGSSTVTSTGTDSIHIRAGESLVMFAAGNTDISAIRTGANDVVIHIIPLAD